MPFRNVGSNALNSILMLYFTYSIVVAAGQAGILYRLITMYLQAVGNNSLRIFSANDRKFDSLILMSYYFF